MRLDEDPDAVLEIDNQRSLTVSTVEGRSSVVLSLEDPHGVTIVELVPFEAEWLMIELRKALDA